MDRAEILISVGMKCLKLLMTDNLITRELPFSFMLCKPSANFGNGRADPIKVHCIDIPIKLRSQSDHCRKGGTPYQKPH